MSKVSLQGNISGSGTLTIAAPNTNSNYTLTLPAESGTLITSGGAIDVSASAPADSLVLDSSGNLGLGVTPSTWNNTFKAMQLGAGGYISGRTNTDEVYLGANGYYDTTDNRWEYIATGVATQYYQDAGTHVWRYAASGTAGNAISFTQAMTLDASGRLGIGVTNPSVGLVVAYGTDGIIGNYYSSSGTNSRISFSNTGLLNNNVSIGSASDALVMYTNATERMRIDSSGNLGLGVTPTYKLDVTSGNTFSMRLQASEGPPFFVRHLAPSVYIASDASLYESIGFDPTNHILNFYTNNTERARITSGGVLLFGKTSDTLTVAGVRLGTAANDFTIDGNTVVNINRLTDDGTLISFYQGNNIEGTISVSGTTVSYNGGHLARWSQTVDNSRLPLLKGTVMSNLDQMADWDGQENEQLNCMKVSDVEGDVNVAGVFVNWDNDDDLYTNDMNIAMTGDMIIRIAQGTTVQRGDLLMSAGDGTAKPQGDDIVRSKTIAKVTSTHVTCTYDDQSYCVPCVLMAC